MVELREDQISSKFGCKFDQPKRESCDDDGNDNLEVLYKDDGTFHQSFRYLSE